MNLTSGINGRKVIDMEDIMRLTCVFSDGSTYDGDFAESLLMSNQKHGTGCFLHAYPDTAHTSILIVCATSQSKTHFVRRHMTRKTGTLEVNPGLKHRDKRIFSEVLPHCSENISELGPPLRRSHHNRGPT